MLGGPYSLAPSSSLMSFVLMRLQHHLALPAPLPEPLLCEVHEHKECIPVPGVGHLQRIVEMRRVLRREEWGRGRLEVMGAGVDGVSVADCVESGRRAGQEWTLRS